MEIGFLGVTLRGGRGEKLTVDGDPSPVSCPKWGIFEGITRVKFF